MNDTILNTKPPVPNAMFPRPYRVREVVTETHDTFTLIMDPVATAPGTVDRRPATAPGTVDRDAVVTPPGASSLTSRTDGTTNGQFEPGQFNMLYLFGVGEVPISISGDPAQTDFLVHTIRAVGSVTNPMRQVQRGTVLGVRGPFGSYWPVHRSKGNDLLIIAGGLGMAPLRPVIYHALANRSQYGRVSLLYGARRPSDMLYPAMLDRWFRHGRVDVHLTVDAATPDWPHDVGVVTRLISRAQFDPNSTTAMVCGPDIMMRYVANELSRLGVPSSEVFVSMERNMKCAIGLCGHCQFGPSFICKDGPVFPIDALQPFFGLREV